ncbi:MAG: DNA-processing protein DprA [Alistipes sp.]|nr:DNA-processing protein DprA [Alistipes sp.]
MITRITRPMIIDEIALSMHRGLTPKTAVHLLEIFGTAAAVYGATRRDLTDVAGLRYDLAREIVEKKFHTQAETELRLCRKKSVGPIGVSCPYYPRLLRETCDHPIVLYTWGNTTALQTDMLAVVGTRKISQYGTAVCEKLIGGLADLKSGLTIVSGLAYGVDSAAHRAALAYGLPTVAVLGNKLPRVYPASHTMLADKIIESGGAIISEMHSGAYEGRTNFIARNRIIAGMSRGTLIVESPEKGGSMITAEMAFGYDRAVMAVPGRITDENSGGTNRIIRLMKAVAVCKATDIVNELGLKSAIALQNKSSEEPIGNINTGDPVLDLIIDSMDGVTADHISDRTGMSASEVLAKLFTLEMEAKVRKLPGGRYVKI